MSFSHRWQAIIKIWWKDKRNTRYLMESQVLYRSIMGQLAEAATEAANATGKRNGLCQRYHHMAKNYAGRRAHWGHWDLEQCPPAKFPPCWEALPSKLKAGGTAFKHPKAETFGHPGSSAHLSLTSYFLPPSLIPP